MENGLDKEEETVKQGSGFAGKLFVIWKGALINMQKMVIVQTDQEEGSLNFIMDAEGKALSVHIKSNEQIAKLIAEQKEGEDTLTNCLEVVHNIIITNLLRDDILIMDLNLTLGTFERKVEQVPEESSLIT